MKSGLFTVASLWLSSVTFGLISASHVRVHVPSTCFGIQKAAVIIFEWTPDTNVYAYPRIIFMKNPRKSSVSF